MQHEVKKYRLLIILSLIVVVPMGFYTKFYAGPGQVWISNSFGGMVYEVFWCLLIALLFPRYRSFGIALGVFLATCILEVLQLWSPPFLVALRAGFIGRTILGSVFSAWDFPYYLLGCLAGWYLLWVFKNLSGVSRRTSGPPLP